MININGSKILVTGATGFLGKHLVNYLRSLGAEVVSVGHKQEGDVQCNLLSLSDCNMLFVMAAMNGGRQYDYVFHLAGYNGGISFNMSNKCQIFHDNTVMGLNIIERAAHWQIKKVVSVVTSCGYPDNNWFNQNMVEDQYLNGEINPTVAAHGYAKRNLLLASKFHNEQYGLNAITICPTTLFGPGDSFDIDKTKVMGGLIRRFLNAKKNNEKTVVCWGTGQAQREFMYVEDACKYATLSLLNYNDSNIPINIGSGQEISIKELARMIAKHVEYDGTIFWDETKPDGQMRKRLNRIRQNYFLGEIELTPLEDGIQKTIDWCIKENII